MDIWQLKNLRYRHHAACNSFGKGFKPYQQKLRKMHPSLEPLVKKELNKMLDAKIIFSVKHTRWIANLVPVRKKMETSDYVSTSET